MPQYRVIVRRYEVWEDEVSVSAADEEAALQQVQAQLDQDGWAAVFTSDDDGDYLERRSEVHAVEPEQP